MTKAVILELSWLDKWGPTIWWEGRERKLKLRIGPLPPPSSPEKEVDQRLEDTKRSDKAKATSEQPPGIALIPKEYQDLAELFSEAECNMLPPH